MSTKYTGGFITKSPVAPTTSAASGIWTLDQQQQAQKAGTWPSPPIFIEDLFSTYLYPSVNGDNQIVNNIDLSTKSGLVWIKSRDTANAHFLIDTVRGSSVGNTNAIKSNTTGAQTSGPFLDYLQFNSNGFTAKAVAGGGELGTNTYYGNMVSWTFREQPKFFDIVTWTGNSTARTIAHNLGSVPGCIMVKAYDNMGSIGGASAWNVYHRSLGNTKSLFLNSTTSEQTSSTYWNNTSPTSTVFTVGTDSEVNANGVQYVAYLWAHDAGGFPVSGGGSTNGISCGSVVADAYVNLGYEPQWILTKDVTDAGQEWVISDNMRGINAIGSSTLISLGLEPNSSRAEGSAASYGGAAQINATGFQLNNASTIPGSTYIYIAIRRGPMKTPTVGTSVFTPIAWTATDAPATVSGFNFPVDLTWHGQRAGVYGSSNVTSWDRLRGAKARLYTGLTDAEGTRNGVTGFDYMSAVQVSNPTTVGEVNYPAGNTEIFWGFRRAPGFFDEVCYTGTGATRTINHNLGVVPEFMIIKGRTGSPTYNWICYHNSFASNQVVELNTTTGVQNNGGAYDISTLSSTVFGVKTGSDTNGNTNTYVAYLFATVAGVSKVGSYTGTGALQTVNCGFTSGARFVLIKRTDSTGAWYVWDSARGITAGDDPYLLLNSTAAEVTNTNYVDTDTTGFKVTAAAPAALNDSGGNYIFLAIA